jgi:hypothetical protein
VFAWETSLPLSWRNGACGGYADWRNDEELHQPQPYERIDTPMFSPTGPW